MSRFRGARGAALLVSTGMLGGEASDARALRANLGAGWDTSSGGVRGGWGRQPSTIADGNTGRPRTTTRVQGRTRQDQQPKSDYGY